MATKEEVSDAREAGARDAELSTAQASLAAALAAAQQEAQQAVQQAAQATQRAEQAMASAQQASRAVGGESSVASLASTIETDVSPISITDAWRVNLKRTHDEYQDIGLMRARNAEDHAQRLRVLTENAIVQLQEHQADLRAQKVRHNELAIDRIWNIDEVAARVVASQAFQDAMLNLTAQVIAKQGQKPGP